mgnify:CR=1 FL=1
MIEKRNLRISYNKSGGTAGKGGMTTRLTLPKKWVDELEITEEHREVIVEFDGEKIIIRKSSNE